MLLHVLHLTTLLIAFSVNAVNAFEESHVARESTTHALRHTKYRQLEAKSLFQRDDCFNPSPNNTLTSRLNKALSSSGAGYVLSLCPNTEYQTTSPILFAFPNQEISTAGYPTDDSRAVITVSGSTASTGGHTTAVDGSCSKCDGVILRNIQINGTRNGAGPISGGANIEFGGANSNQTIEFVRSFNPRGWSCLHVAEGQLNCNNVTVRNNDIGPCGTDAFQQWADGISFACRNGVVRNNLINNPTDGGIVLFGAPGTLVENNTIWIEANTLLGGINMVDVSPFNGDYNGTIVQKNAIVGGFATGSSSSGSTDGDDSNDAIIKIGIAIGPRTWFGNEYGNNVSQSGTVLDNTFSGAFGYGMAMSSALNFTVNGNTISSDTSFIGSRGPNCSSSDDTPTPAAFVYDASNVKSSTIQFQFQNVSDGDSLTCILPPPGGNYWPYGGNPDSSADSMTPPVQVPEPNASDDTSSGSSAGRTAGLVIGILAGIVAIGAAAWYIRKRTLTRRTQAQNDLGKTGYVRSTEQFTKPY